MSESYYDQLGRVEAMTEDHGCMWGWDLSPREKLALKAMFVELASQQATISQLTKELAEAREELLVWGQHHPTCASDCGLPCDCGWKEIKKAAKQLEESDE